MSSFLTHGRAIVPPLSAASFRLLIFCAPSPTSYVLPSHFVSTSREERFVRSLLNTNESSRMHRGDRFSDASLVVRYDLISSYTSPFFQSFDPKDTRWIHVKSDHVRDARYGRGNACEGWTRPRWSGNFVWSAVPIDWRPVDTLAPVDFVPFARA